MNATSPETSSEPRWLTYTKAGAFALPAVAAWCFACIFLVPKAKEIAEHAGLEIAKLGWIWTSTMFLVVYGRNILIGGIVALALLEFLVPAWRRWRQLTLGISTWLANVVVFCGLILLLIIVLVAAPGLAHAR